MLKGIIIIVFLALWSEVKCCSQTNLVLQNNLIYNFNSTYFPNPYPSATFSCVFQATAPAGQKIYAYCDTFSILNTDQCLYSRFYFSPTGDTTYSDANIYCGYYSSLTFTTTTNKIAMRFDNYWYNSYNQQGIRCYIGTWPTVTTTTNAPPSCNCGYKNVVSRIVGGQVTSANEYPWMATIMQTGEAEPFCGGALISNQWVLTATHCMLNFQPTQIEVILGAQNLGPNSQSGIRLSVSQIIMHESYDEDTVDNDIAVIKLVNPVTFTTTISPVCLPFKFTNTDFEGSMGTVTGWGTTQYQGSTSVGLREVDIPILSTATCANYHNGNTVLTGNMFCTLQAGKDACQGDSGGPLIVPSGGRYYEIGIVSWGIKCDEPNKPGVYTKITNYLGWIQTKTSASFCNV